MYERHTFTVREYLALDRASERRFEYVDGTLRLLVGGSLNHALIVTNLAYTLSTLLRDGHCRVFSSDARVKLSSRCYVYPDLTVSCDQREELRDDLVRYPLVVIEVLSPSTEGFDKKEKLRLYKATNGLQEIVLVHSGGQFIEVYRRSETEPGLWSYHSFSHADEFGLASLNVRCPVGTVYEQTTVPEELEGEVGSERMALYEQILEEGKETLEYLKDK